MFSKEMLQELRGIMKEDYGQNYTSKEVFDIAQGLVGLFDNLTQFDWKDKNGEKGELHKSL